MTKLADTLTNFANKPIQEDFDPEDNESKLFNHKDHMNSSDDDDDDFVNTDNNKSLEKSHYININDSKLRNKNSSKLNDEKYTGTVSSRANLFDEDEIIEEEESEDEIIEESDAMSFKSDSEDKEISESESSLESDSESQIDNTDSKKKRLAKLINQETKTTIKKLSNSTQNDAIKGLSIINQMNLFDNILDSRIKLQKAISSSNNLPITKESWNIFINDSKKTNTLLNDTSTLLNKVLSQIINLRNDFQNIDNINQNKDKVITSSNNKRSFETLINDTDKLDNDLKIYRNAVLQKWSTKIQSASGKSALQSNKFKAINQSADIQVENQLTDLSRSIKRTRLNRKNIIPLGFNDDLKNSRLDSHIQSSDFITNANDDDDLNNPDLPKNYDPRRKDNQSIDTSENPYIFDDEDFYRVLLNDLVDKKITNSQNNNNNMNNVTLSSRSNDKIKKNIDTKASKGRKLNYSIQEPIAHYEAPVTNHYKWNDEQIDEFFASLLGQKINFDENESTIESDNDNNAEIEAIKNDDIQIFG